MDAVKLVAVVLVVIPVLFAQGHSLESRKVALFTVNSSVFQLGSVEKVEIVVKNVEDYNASVRLHIGSKDKAFRNWIWFENNRYNKNRVREDIMLGPHEERSVIVNVFSGKTGEYELLVGPDTYNVYDSTAVRIVMGDDGGLFSISPGLYWPALLIVLIAGSKVLLSRGFNR